VERRRQERVHDHHRSLQNQRRSKHNDRGEMPGGRNAFRLKGPTHLEGGRTSLVNILKHPMTTTVAHVRFEGGADRVMGRNLEKTLMEKHHVANLELAISF